MRMPQQRQRSIRYHLQTAISLSKEHNSELRTNRRDSPNQFGVLRPVELQSVQEVLSDNDSTYKQRC